jgi:hypothetical protein
VSQPAAGDGAAGRVQCHDNLSRELDVEASLASLGPPRPVPPQSFGCYSAIMLGTDGHPSLP